MFWRNSLAGVSIIDEIVNDRICGLRVQDARGTTTVVLSVYMPAVGAKDDLASTLDDLSGILYNFDDDVVPIICGDFNGDMGRNGGPRGRGVASKQGKLVANFMCEHKMITANLLDLAIGPMHTYESHKGYSCIDYIMLPEFMEDAILTCKVLGEEALNTSDHFPICMSIRMNRLPCKIDINNKKQRIKWDKWDDFTMNSEYRIPLSRLLADLNDRIFVSPCEPNELDNFFDELIMILHKSAEVLPRCKFANHLKPYWDEELTILKKNKMKWFRIWKEKGRPREKDDPDRIRMSSSKNEFAKRLRQISKKYYNEQIASAAHLAEIDKNLFWKTFRRMKGYNRSSSHAIKRPDGNVVYSVEEVLKVWETHFDKICTPKSAPEYDEQHYRHVTESVKAWFTEDGVSNFLDTPFTIKEIDSAISKLHLGKAPGFDDISTEHLRYAGPVLSITLCELYNACIKKEYVPLCFRKGVQVPLYKGKGTCSLNPDNYRGITLLSNFNKMFEVLIWARLNVWWVQDRVVSDLQGACRKGSSCIHIALTLQETISKERERGKKVFVAYYDVSKAFDSVWIDGLFFQLYNLGIRDSLWRILYKMYLNFACCIKIGNQNSSWYSMDCGIHQGGFLSLMKYTAFIDSLLRELEASNLCSSIYRIPSSPVGYADDLAACTLNKRKMDLAMELVYKHSCVWRYCFNPGKSAVLVYGESPRERELGSRYREFKLGKGKVHEKLHYDHVGIKSCLMGYTDTRTLEKVEKGTKVLNMATNMGVMRGGLNLYTCCMIYWSVVFPTLSFGSEIWVLKAKDVELLRGFQRYAARRLQRLHARSINSTSIACLGWLDIIRAIKGKQLIFIRTIACLDVFVPIRRIFVERLGEFHAGNGNQFDSPILQLLETAVKFDVLEYVQTMFNGNIISKAMWKRIIWEKMWVTEKQGWNEKVRDDKHFDLISKAVDGPGYSIWWSIADHDQSKMKQCETMVKLITHTSLLKGDDGRLKREPFGSRMCILCNLCSLEDTNHMIMQCPVHENLRV